MTVEELIAYLSKQDPDKIVCLRQPYTATSSSYMPFKCVELDHEMKTINLLTDIINP